MTTTSACLCNRQLYPPNCFRFISKIRLKLRSLCACALCIHVTDRGQGLFLYLECAVVSLQLPAQTLQLAASQDGFAVFIPQVVFLLDQLVLLLLQRPHLLLGVSVLFQL